MARKETRARFTLSGVAESMNEAREEQTAWQRKVMDLAAGISQASKDMQAALDAGNLGEYAKHKARREQLEASASDMKEDIISQRVYKTREAARTETYKRWNSYAGEYNRVFSAAYDAYKKARKELCENYLALVKMQNEALRNYLDFMGFMSKNDLIDNEAHCEKVEWLDSQNIPEADFLERTGMTGHRYGIKSIVKERQPVSEEVLDGTAPELHDPRLSVFNLVYARDI